MGTERDYTWVHERTGDRPCPFCAAIDWLALDSVNGVVVVEAAEGIQHFAGYPVDLEESDLTTIKAVAFACRQCGFVRFHMHPGG
jgi:hypothetical protein